MKSEPDIRWKQRLANYQNALQQMGEFLSKDSLNKFEAQGLVQAFEYTYELAWNTLKDFLEYQGVAEIVGSRDAFRKAFATGIVREGQVWMRMSESRNQTIHTYNETTAREIVLDVKTDFYPAFCALEKTLSQKALVQTEI